MVRWNISDSPNDNNRRALREAMPPYFKKLFNCCECDGPALYRHNEAVPFFHETANYASGGILFLFLCPNNGDLNNRRRMCTDFWRWQEQRGLARGSDWTNLYFHELLYAQFGLLQHQIITMNAVLCAPPSDGDPNKPHEKQMGYCLKTLAARVAILDPRIVIVLGKDASVALKKVRVPVPSWPGPYGSWSKPARWLDDSSERWVFVAPHPAAAKQGGHYRIHKMHEIWGKVRDGINELIGHRLSPGVPTDLACPNTESAATDDSEGGLAYVINQAIRAAIETPRRGQPLTRDKSKKAES